MEQKTAIVFGASGLIGHEVVTALLADETFTEVKAVVRRNMPLSHPKLKVIIADYQTIKDKSDQLAATVIFSCLGSTMKETPNREAYYQIDHDYPIRVGGILKKHGAKQFHLVSSIGANASSGNFYLRMKGETERDISAMGFESVYIYRPSLLVGDRPQKRPAERFFTLLMNILNPILIGSLKKYRSITGKTVAQAMVIKAKQPTKGIFILETDAIKQLV